MPERIIRLSEAYMRNTEVLRVESQHLTADLTNQI
jgi:ATP-dependent RNA helicase DeaD